MYAQKRVAGISSEVVVVLNGGVVVFPGAASTSAIKLWRLLLVGTLWAYASSYISITQSGGRSGGQSLIVAGRQA